MTLTQVIELGLPGEEILTLLSDLKSSAIQSKTMDGYQFEDVTHQKEYIQSTIDMIKIELCKLQQK